MKNTIEIRPAAPGDVPRLAELVREYWRFEHIDGFDGGRVAGLLRRLLASPERGHAWLALVDGEAAGYLVAVYVFSLEHQGMTAEIDELFVLPRFRSAGLGARLLSTAEREFVDGGFTQMFLQVSRDNPAARRFYRRHGFRDRAGFDLIDKSLCSGSPTNDG